MWYNWAMITFVADKIKINGPQIDGGYSVTFYTGEYTKQEVAKLLSLNEGNLKITVEEEK